MNYNEDADEWTLDESDGKEVTVSVTVPGIPSDWPPQEVADWVYNRLTHPLDSAYEAMVQVSVVSEKPHGTEPRENNGCMINKKGSPPS